MSGFSDELHHTKTKKHCKAVCVCVVTAVRIAPPIPRLISVFKWFDLNQTFPAYFSHRQWLQKAFIVMI